MIDKELSKKATFEDGILLKAIHPLKTGLLYYIGNKWRFKKVPVMGTVISDPAIILAVFMNKKKFSEDEESSSTSFWNSIIGDYGSLDMDGEDQLKLKRVVSNMFAKERVELIYGTVTASIFEETAAQLKAGENVNMVEMSEEISYLSMWHIVGLSAEKLRGIDFKLAVRTLRSVTEGLNPAKKKFSQKQVDIVKGKLTFLDELVREAYNNDERVSIPLCLKQEGFSEEAAISLTKSLFFAGTETVISFLPRMTALFLKTRYIDYLSEHPEHVGKGVEEALRVTVPTPVTVRSVTETTEFHGMSLKKGERLVLSTIGASKRFGDFNPFNDVDQDIRSIWFCMGVRIWLGVGIAISQAEAMAKFLAKVNADSKLGVILQASDDKGHTGNYKHLVITCKTS